MAATLIDLHGCKRFLKKRAKSTDEDELIQELLDSVLAMIATYLASLSAMRGKSIGGTWSAIRSVRRSNDLGSATTVITLLSLQDEDDYESRIIPALNQDIRDCVAHLYKNRSPNATSESEGGGISEGWDDVGMSGLPKRVERRLKTLVSTLSVAA